MPRLPALPLSEISRFRGGPRGIVVLIAIALIPALYGGLMVWSFFDPSSRLEGLTAAVVNEDEPVTIIDADGVEQVIPLGRTLAGELTSSTATDNYTWVLTDAEDGLAGLEDGSFAALITIPEDFSAAATSTSGEGSPSEARQAVLSVQTNDAASYLTGNITRLIADAVTQTLSETVSQTYLENVYVGFTTVHDQVAAAAEGAEQLADGSARLADGASDVDSGAIVLTDGLGALSGGADDLATGNARLADGASDLNRGLGAIASQVGDLPTQASQLDAGAHGLAAGAEAARAGSSDLAAGLGQLQSATTDLSGAVTELDDGTQELLATVADQLAPGAEQVTTGAGQVSAGVDEYTAAVGSMRTEICATLQTAPSPDPRMAMLCGAVEALDGQSADLRQGAGTVAAGAAAVSSGISGGSDPGSPSLLDGLTRLQGGTAALAEGVPAIAAAVGSASTGATELTLGLDELASGAAGLAAGTSQLAVAAPQLNDGIMQASSGAGTVATGAHEAARGAEAVAEGAADASSGASQLVDGTAALVSGAQETTSGARELATALDDGASEVPTYTDAEAALLAEVAAAPVTSNLSHLNAVASNGYGFAPYFMSLAAWIGAMAMYMILGALPRRAIASMAPSWRVALAGYVPGAVLSLLQALLMVAVVRFWVGVESTHLIGLFVFAVAMGLCFTAINQALIASFGTAGRFVGFVFLALQLTSAGATYPIETAPGFFQALHPLLPMSSSVEALRGLIAGGGLGVGGAYLMLLLWTSGALAVTVLAAHKQRRWTLDRLHPALVL